MKTAQIHQKPEDLLPVFAFSIWYLNALAKQLIRRVTNLVGTWRAMFHRHQAKENHAQNAVEMGWERG